MCCLICTHSTECFPVYTVLFWFHVPLPTLIVLIVSWSASDLECREEKYFGCWSYHVGRWIVNETTWKPSPNCQSRFLKTELQKPSFRSLEFWGQLGSVRFLENQISDIFIGFRRRTHRDVLCKLSHYTCKLSANMYEDWWWVSILSTNLQNPVIPHSIWMSDNCILLTETNRFRHQRMHDCREAVKIADCGVSEFNGSLDPVVNHSDTLDGITRAQYQHRHQQLETIESVWTWHTIIMHLINISLSTFTCIHQLRMMYWPSVVVSTLALFNKDNQHRAGLLLG